MTCSRCGEPLEGDDAPTVDFYGKPLCAMCADDDRIARERNQHGRDYS